VSAAARYFNVPARAMNTTPDWIYLDDPADVERFNRGLTCGAKLIKLRRTVDHFVVGMFKLTERPGAGRCGTGTGELAAVAFQIRKARITQWVRVDPSAPVPGATATPTPTPTPTPTTVPGTSSA
jgi:hypothetical protein